MTITDSSSDSSVDASTPLPRGWARLLSTRHPGAMYVTGAVEVVAFVAIGSFLATRSVVGGVLVALIGVIGSIIPFGAGHWSRKHPDLAEKTVAINLARRNRLARRHPAYFVVFIPILVSVDVAVRWHRIDHSSTASSWWIPAIIGLAFGAALGAFVLERAHRHPGTSRAGTSHARTSHAGMSRST